MKKLALYGAGGKSLDAERVVKTMHLDIMIDYLIENKDFSKIGNPMYSFYENKRMDVISLETFVSLYEKKEVDGLIVPSTYHLFDLRDILELCQKNGIDKKDIYTIPFNTLKKPVETLSEQDIGLVRLDELEQIGHLDIHIVDNCNLKCKSCSHFAPLVNTNVMIETSEYEKNLKRLQELVSNICDIALLGGEPLLHPDIEKIVQKTREYYPYAEISLITNGILLENMTDSLVQTLKDNHIIVSISLYPPLYKKIDTFLDYLKKHGLPYRITKIEKFERKLFEEPCMDAYKMTQYCGHLMCLRGDRIGRCVTAMFTDYYNDTFDKKLPVDYGIDIFQDLTARELLDKLREPLELCKQCCARDHYYEEWELAGDHSQATDWFLHLSVSRGGKNL